MFLLYRIELIFASSKQGFFHFLFFMFLFFYCFLINCAMIFLQDCPSGFYCPLPNRSPIECPSGYTSVSRQSNCSVCPPGYACPNAANPSTAVPCLPGTFSPGAQTTCTACPPSFACPFTDRFSPPSIASYSSSWLEFYNIYQFFLGCVLNICIYIQIEWKNNFQLYSWIQTCVCNIYRSTLIPCGNGTYSSGSQSSCTVCPAGILDMSCSLLLKHCY